MKKLMFLFVCLISIGYIQAQEAEAAAVGSDGGTDVVQAAQDAGPAPASEEFKNAKAVLDDLAAKKGWSEGWDEEKGRIIVVADADFKTMNPGQDKDFFAKREMAAKRAVLEAKTAIIEMINTEMSASEKLDMPGTDVNKALSAESDKINAAMAEQQAELAALLEQTNKAEAAALRGTTFGQRLDDLMAATIKKLDKDYNANKHDDAAKARFNELKAKYATTTKEFAELKKKAEEIQANVQAKQESSVTTMARMPLYGSTVLMQTESWDNATGIYQVAVMLTWSKALERAVRAIVIGEDYKTKPGKKSVNMWLNGQNIATMIGPRQYVDDKGNRWFLGVSARKYDASMSSMARKKAKGLTEMFARQMAAFCVFADVESFKQASQAMETRGNENESVDAVAESYAEKLSQSFAKKTVRGMQKLAGKELKHPITGDKIYVAVFGLNASAAAAALEAEKLNYATKIMDNRHQTVERGRRAANEAAVKASENRPEDFQKGHNEQSTAIQNELKKREASKKPAGGVSIINKSQGKPASQQNKKNTSGTFSGDADVEDDF